MGPLRAVQGKASKNAGAKPPLLAFGGGRGAGAAFPWLQATQGPQIGIISPRLLMPASEPDAASEANRHRRAAIRSTSAWRAAIFSFGRCA